MGKITSVMQEDTKHCYLCGSRDVEPHHCLHGYSDRKWAEKFHLVVALCRAHHSELHDRNTEMDRYFQRLAQEAFEEHYPELNFRDYFRKNYK